MKKFIAVVALVTLLFLAADATHFRFGTITWSVPSPTDYSTVFFTVNTGWRRSFYEPLNGNPGHASPSATPKPSVGDTLIQQIINSNRYYFFNPGDGDQYFSGQYITSVNSDDDWIMTTWNFTYSYPQRAGTYTAFHTQSARISSLKNNADLPWNITARVIISLPPNPIADYKPNNSPVTAALPIIPVRFGTDLVYKLPATDPDTGDFPTFSMATAAQMGGGVVCPELTVDSDGTVRFLASKASIVVGAYQTQQIITDRFGAFIPVDYILNVTKQAGFCQCNGVALSTVPCTEKANCTSLCGSTGSCLLSDPTFVFSSTTVGKTNPVTADPEIVLYDAGTFINIPIVADDLPFPAKYPVTIYSSGIPRGAIVTPQANCNNAACKCVGSDCRNPQVVYLQWATTSANAGVYSVCFGAVQTATTPSTYYAKGQTCVSFSIVPPKCNSGTLNTSQSCTDNFVAANCCTCPAGFDPASRCLSCKDGYFGSTCQPCPNCNNGTCSAGIGGTGTCVCDPGYSGVNCQNPTFKFCDPSAQSYIQSQTTSGSSMLNPTSVFLYMAVNAQSQGSASVSYTLTTPSPPSLDLVFVQDLSASTLQADLTALTNKVGSLMTTLLQQYPGTAASFASISGSPSSYRAYGPLTSSVSTLTGYISKMAINGTSTEATIPALSAVAQTNMDTSYQWRYNSYRAVIFLTRKADSGVISSSAFSSALAMNSANVLFLAQGSSVVSTYTTLVNNFKFGIAAQMASNQDDWDSTFRTQIALLSQQVATAVYGDTNNMFTPSALTTSALGKTVTKSATFTFPSGVLKGTIRTLPTPTVSFLGWASTAVTIVLNRAPTSQNSIFSVTQDTPYPFQIPSADADNNLLTVNFTRLPVNGTIKNGDTPVVLYTRYQVSTFNASFINDFLWNGNTSFSYILHDGCDPSAEYTAYITVNAINYPPTVKNFVVNLNQGSSASVNFTPQLADLDNTVASLRVFVDDSSKVNGALTTGGVTISSGEVANQALSYTPTSTFYGNASFTYYARDGQSQSTSATVTFVVKFVNKNPIFSGSTSPTLNIGTTTSFNITISDVDIPDSASISFVNNLRTGRVTAVRFQSAGKTDATTATANPIFTGLPSSPNGAIIQISITTDDSASGSLGSFTLNAVDQYTGSASITISPVAAANTPPFYTSVTYVNVTGGVTYTSPVSPNNVRSVVVTEDGSVRITIVGSDLDGTQGGNLTFGVSGNPSNGDLSTGSGTPVPSTLASGGFTFDTVERTNPGTKTSSYTIVYKPDLYFFGSDSFTVFFKDQLASATALTVNLNVLFSNHAPSLRAASESVTLPIGANYTLSYSVSDPDTIDAESISVVSYSLTHITGIWYSDETGIRYLGTSLSKGQQLATGLSPSDSFSLIFQTDDTPVSPVGSLGLIANDKFGGNGTSTVTFNAANSVPPFVTSYLPNVEVLEDGSLKLTVVASDTDGKQGANLTFFVSIAPSNGVITTGNAGSAVTPNVAFNTNERSAAVKTFNSTSTYTYTYTPNKLFFGIDSVKFYLKDALGTVSVTYTTTFNVTFVNHNPVVTAPSQVTLPIGANATFTVNIADPDTIDAESVVVSASSLKNVTGIWIVAKGVTTFYNPATIVNKVVATDLAPVSSFQVIIQTDDYPVGSLGSITFLANDKFGGSGSVSVGATAANDLPPVVTYYEAAITLPEDGSVKTTIVGGDPDGKQGANLQFFIATLPKNGAILTGTGLTTVSANAAFPNSERISVEGVVPGTSSSNFSYNYVPNKLFFGTDSVTFYVKDPLGTASGTYTATFNVTFVNHNPVVTAPSQVTLPIGNSTTFIVNIADPDTIDAEYVVITSNSLKNVTGFSVIYNGVETVIPSFIVGTTIISNLQYRDAFTIKLTTDDYPVGSLGSLTLTAYDKFGGSGSATISATAANDAPPFVINYPSIVTLVEDGNVVVNVVATDTDGMQGTTLDFIVSTLPSNGIITTGKAAGAVTVNSVFGQSENTPDNTAKTSTYSFRYTPKLYWFGLDTVTFFVRDVLGGASIKYTTTLNVTFVNHPPILQGPSSVLCVTGGNCVISLTINDYDLNDIVSLKFNQTTLETGATLAGSSITVAGTSTSADNAFTTKIVKSGINTGNAAVSATFTLPISGSFTGKIGNVTFFLVDQYGGQSDNLFVALETSINNAPFRIDSNSVPVGFTVVANSGLQIKLNGSDPDSADQAQGLVLYVLSLPVNGTLSLTSGGASLSTGTSTAKTGVNAFPGNGSTEFTLFYKPNEYTHGSDSFSYYFQDPPGAQSNIYTQSFTVQFYNHPPTVSTSSNTYTCALGAVCNIGITVADPDIPDAVSLVMTSFGLTFVESANSTFSTSTTSVYKLGQTFTGPLTFQSNLPSGSTAGLALKINDNAVGDLGSFVFKGVDQHTGESALYTVRIQAGANTPPYVIAQDPSNPVQLVGDGNVTVSVNGTDVDGQQGSNLTLVILSYPSSGILKVGGSTVSSSSLPYTVDSGLNVKGSLGGQGVSKYSVQYVPNIYFSGNDSFTYVLKDALGGSTPVQTANLQIQFVNHKPSVTTLSGTYQCAIGAVCKITATVTDPDPGDLSTLFLSAYSLKYVEFLNATYSSVNKQGVAPGTSFTTQKDLASSVSSGSSVDILLKIADNAAGNLGSFSIYAKDSHNGDSSALSIAVNAGANSPPYLIAQDPLNPVPLVGDTGASVKINGSDVDGLQGSNLTLIITSYPSSGTLKTGNNVPIPATTGNSFVAFPFPSSENQKGTFDVSGKTQGSSTFTVQYAPNLYFSGSDSFSYILRDELGGTTDVLTVSFNVSFVNHPPAVTSSSNSYQCAIGAVCKITATVTDPDPGDLSTLFLSAFNMNYVDFLNATYSSVNKQGVAPGASFTNEVDLASSVSSGSSVDILLKINDNAVGDLGSFSIYAKDSHNGNSSPLSISVRAGSNSPPRIVSQTPINPVPLVGDGNATVTVVGTDDDGLQGSNLTFVILSLPSSGIVYTSKTPSTVSSAGFVFPSSENTPGSIGTKGSSSYGFVYVPNKYFNGKDSFTYAMVDALGSSTAPQTVNFDVAFFNHPPVISTLSPNVVCGIGMNCTLDFSIVDYDDALLDSEKVELSAFSLKHATAVYAVNPATGETFKLSNAPEGVVLSGLATRSSARLIVTFDSEITGSLGSFQINARDSYNASSEVLTISITAAPNNPPKLSSPEAPGNVIVVQLKEDGNISITVTGTDADGTQGSSLSLVMDKMPAEGKIVDSKGNQNTDGNIDPSTNSPFVGSVAGTSTSTYTFTYTPIPLFSGSDSLFFHFKDLLGGTSVVYTIQLNVTHVNHPPTGSSFSVSGLSGIPIVFAQFTGSDIDKQDTVYLQILSLPTNGTLFDASGIKIALDQVGKRMVSPSFTKDLWGLSFVSDDYISGYPLTSFQFRFFDGQEYSPENYTATIDITTSNYPPIAYPVLVEGSLNAVAIFVANATDANDAAGTLTVNIVKGPSGGVICVDASLFNCITTGSIYRNESTPIYYKPNANQFGSPYDYFTYTVSDPKRATSDPVNATINVIFVNQPPVAEFSDVLNVFENDQVTVTLSASDDRTPAQSLKYVVEKAPLKGLLTISTDEGVSTIDSSVTPFTLLESKRVTFSPVIHENGDNYANFVVTIEDQDGGLTRVTIIINVIPVNDPPELHYETTRISRKENTPFQFGFNGTDIDSPANSLVGVVSRFPQRGKIYQCLNWTGIETDICQQGPEIVLDASATLQKVPSIAVVQDSTGQDVAIWRFFFVPAENEVSKVYATPSFLIVDDKLAKSNAYTLSIGITAINKPPVVNASGEYNTLLNAAITIQNVTAVDSDAGGLPVMVVISTNNGTLNFTTPSAFKAGLRTPAPCRVLEEGRVINCTARQQVIAKFLPTLSYSNSFTGTYNVTVFMDDLGAGAEVDDRATSRLTDQKSVSVSVSSLAPGSPKTSNLSLTIGLASAGGALMAAGAVGAAARFMKKPDDTLFAGMIEFDSNAIVSNPLYVENDGSAVNPLYEDEAV